MASPIQIVLNPENFETARETPAGGDKQDFFADHDADFKRHKRALIAQLSEIQKAIRGRQVGQIGYVKVTLRREAWAKSHRPVQSLFKPARARLAGGEDLGVMIFELHADRIDALASEIASAEEKTTWVENKFRNKLVPHPSTRRSETGAIERIDLYGPEDRRAFSAANAIDWLNNPLTGSSYSVELFDTLPIRSDWDVQEEARQQLYRSFIDGIARLGTGLRLQTLQRSYHAESLFSVRLEKSTAPPLILLGPPTLGRGDLVANRGEVAAFDPDPVRHDRLLKFLESHPLVRKIELPGILTASDDSTGRARGRFSLAKPDKSRSYPKIGIIDGGISDWLSDWILDRWDLLANKDRSIEHGTFIAGLALAGRGMNGAIFPEADGAQLVDVAVFPDEKKATAFSSYFPYGLDQFFDELDAAIAAFRQQHRVRIFNMSLNIKDAATPERYSRYAGRLDQIAETRDVIVVVSAGNVAPPNMRPEWPSDHVTALAQLAQANNDRILRPAESVRNVTVGALNPPGHPASISHAPARYSRRGPVLRTGVKPDFAHVGGSGTNSPPMGYGLFSTAPNGALIDGCGTSYAAPGVAKTLAALDAMIQGEASRETLIALLVHNARVPAPLESATLKSVARQLVGFGMPISAEGMLETDEHQITLVFASRIRKGQQIVFPFTWPSSLTDNMGRCRGGARLTVVSTPRLDARFGAEFVRVNIEGSLQQQRKDGHWTGQLHPLHIPSPSETPLVEAELIEHGLKWSPVKIYARELPRGIGKSSNWRLTVKYLTRAGEDMTPDGVPFTAILSLYDPEKKRRIFNEVRQSFRAQGIQIADIRVAARIATRV